MVIDLHTFFYRFCNAFEVIVDDGTSCGRWRMYSFGELAEMVSARPDDGQSVYFSPFVTLERLYNAGLIRGIFAQGAHPHHVVLPFACAPLRGILLGGYLHSEILAMCSGTPEWSGFPDLLAENNIPYIRAESLEADPTLSSLRACLEQKGWNVQFYQGKQSPYLDFPKEREADGFYALFRKANAKECRNLLASQRKMEAAHTVTMEFLHQPLDDELASRLATVEQKGWKKDLGIFSVTRKKNTLALFGDTVLDLGLLYLDGTLVAWDIDVCSGNIIYSYNRSYDAEYASFAPGKILHYETLKRAYEKGVERVYIMGGADALKMRFASGTTQRVYMQAFSPSVVGKALCLGLAAKRALVGTVQRMRGGASELD